MSERKIYNPEILEVIDDLSPKFNGIKYLNNYLRHTYDTLNSRKPKPSLMEIFRINSKNLPGLDSTERVWKKIKVDGDVRNAFVSSFDWDLAPEGYAFWEGVNQDFIKKYKHAIENGLKIKDNTPMINSDYDNGFFSPTQPYKFEGNTPSTHAIINGDNKYSEITILPSSVTLKMMAFLSPTIRHTVYPQIDSFLAVLDKYKCKSEFFSNLRNKPKHDTYEKEFEDMMKTGDIRTVVYWAFNWSATKEGFQFWSNVNASVNTAITNELCCGYHMPQTYNQPKDSITRLNLAIPQVETPKQKVSPSTVNGPFNPNPCYGYQHYRPLYDDYYDEYYGGGGYSTYSYSYYVPKDIINMPVNNDYIEVSVKKEVTALAK